jgi:hypothetical protein
MRPDLVKCMVLDGVSNAESYFDDFLQWGRDGMTDTHKVCYIMTLCTETNKLTMVPDTYRLVVNLR